MDRLTRKLINEYREESEVCVAEFLAWKEVPAGMTFEEAFETYIKVMKSVEKDKFYTVKDDETLEL